MGYTDVDVIVEGAIDDHFEPDGDGLMACPRCGKRLDFVAWRNHHCEDPDWYAEAEPEPEPVVEALGR